MSAQEVFTDIEIAILKQKTLMVAKKYHNEQNSMPVQRTMMEGYIEALDWMLKKVLEIEDSGKNKTT